MRDLLISRQLQKLHSATWPSDTPRQWYSLCRVRYSSMRQLALARLKPSLAAIWMDASSRSCRTGCKADAQHEWTQVRHSTCQLRCGGAAGGNRGDLPWHCTSVNLQIYSKCLEVPLQWV